MPRAVPNQYYIQQRGPSLAGVRLQSHFFREHGQGPSSSHAVCSNKRTTPKEMVVKYAKEAPLFRAKGKLFILYSSSVVVYRYWVF